MAEAFRSRKNEKRFCCIFLVPRPLNHQHAALKGTFLKGMLARTMVARDDKCQVAWNVPVHPARSARSAATILTVNSRLFAPSLPCGLSRPVECCILHQGILSGLAALRWTLAVVLWWSPARNASGFILANLCGRLHCCAVGAFPTMDPGRRPLPQSPLQLTVELVRGCGAQSDMAEGLYGELSVCRRSVAQGCGLEDLADIQNCNSRDPRAHCTHRGRKQLRLLRFVMGPRLHPTTKPVNVP